MRNTSWAFWWLSLIALFLAESVPAESIRYEVVPDVDDTELVFHSKATMESFDGTTRSIAGWVELDPDDLGAGVAWDLRVDLRSLDTGIGLRNRHMRDNHLHTDEHPFATFSGDVTLTGTLPAGSSSSLELEGAFILHGVSVTRKVPVAVARRGDGALIVSAEFEVSLAAHDIPRPKFLVLKLADDQRVELHFLARPARSDG